MCEHAPYQLLIEAIVRIEQLKLTNFRNFHSFSLAPESVNLLLGPNGVGKTNILEAIYIASVGRSYRTRRDSETITWGESANRAEVAIVSSKDKKQKIAVAQQGDKKICFLEDKPMPLSLLAGHLPVVVFSPESMDLPEAAPTKRRRLIDVLLAQIEPGYTKRLLKYNHVVKARNKLLDRIKFGKGEVGELTFWDEQLVELGGAIITLRQKYARTLDSRIKKCFTRINNAREKEQKIAFYYQSSIQDVDRFREELENARERELRYANTVLGPHRDDWVIKINGADVRVAASRGETRTALLALKMAEASILSDAKSETPVLLLDDVFAELDKCHSEAILELFNNSQVFITATDAEYIPDKVRAIAKLKRVG